MAKLDLEQLLRDLTGTLAALRSHAEARRTAPELFALENPYERRRWVSTLSTFQELDRADPAWPYLASWVLWLLLGRTCHEAEGTEALARAEVSLRVATPTPLELSPREATRRLVQATSEGERALLARALEVGCGEASGAALELWMRRGEVLRRAGGDALAPLLQPMESWAALRAEAEATLAATDDLAQATLGGAGSWWEALARGVGQEGAVPWPRRLSVRWLLAPFEGEAGWLDIPDLTPGTLPGLAGGSSVARGLVRLGARWADAAAPRHLAAPLARLPSGLARWSTGALFASLLLTPVFLRRGLGLGSAEAARARRQQGLAALVALRLEALRATLLIPALQGDRRAVRQEFREGLRRALGAAAPEGMALALPRLQATSPARLLAFGQAAASARRLREAHDEDWFRNPKAVLALRDRLDRAPTPNLSAAEAEEARGPLLEALVGALG
jgi:hypothetical protein